MQSKQKLISHLIASTEIKNKHWSWFAQFSLISGEKRTARNTKNVGIFISRSRISRGEKKQIECLQVKSYLTLHLHFDPNIHSTSRRNLKLQIRYKWRSQEQSGCYRAVQMSHFCDALTFPPPSLSPPWNEKLNFDSWLSTLSLPPQGLRNN